MSKPWQRHHLTSAVVKHDSSTLSHTLSLSPKTLSVTKMILVDFCVKSKMVNCSELQLRYISEA
ncbi:hypothetical protein GBAR_LOCUS19259 [Geodia barretti]|uniref:Uncharacterized protein n=1 Tax=Geodia barretti TaxID=519541 RepID=A0AA35WUD3_GEOBA|nr:hypothetical protein GBAR_LOCUS19259 [Geodia barretti]